MKKITYIIPLYEFNKKIEKFYVSAIDSLNNVKNNEGNKVIFVGPANVVKKAMAVCKPNIETDVVENTETDFFTQINKAVYQCVTPYFTILEIDDTLKPFWNDTMQEYMAMEASVMIPINEFIKDGNFVSFGNEIAWSYSFANETSKRNEKSKGLGYLDIDCLETYMDFNVTGGIIKTEDFISIGGLKPSLKIASWYEFLLRACYNSKDVYVVPKAAYAHTIGRENSYMENSAKEISPEYGKWLITTARQEYFFNNDRNIEFVPSNANN